MVLQLSYAKKHELYTLSHCYGHLLNLVAADTVKRSALMKCALDTTYEIPTLVKYSPRRGAILRHSKVN